MSDPSASPVAPAAPGTPVAPPRESPLHAAHVAAGASFTDFAGWQMPVRYTSDLAEHHAVRSAAGVFDLSHMAEIGVAGPEATAFLDAALAGSFGTMPVGRAKYSLLLADDGGILDDLVVYRTDDDTFLVVANAANREVAVSALQARVVAPSGRSFDVEVSDDSDTTALVAIQGPAAAGTLDALVVEDRLQPETPLDELRYYRVLHASFDGQGVLVARTGYTGEDGFEIYCPPELAPTIWDALLDTGADRGVVPAGLASRDTLRLEAGMPLYGHELDTTTRPAQAGLGRVVAMDTTFVGRDGVAPAEDAPVLVGIVMEGRRAARAGYPVMDGDRRIGVVTSGALSPTLGHPVAMAFVEPGYTEPGTVLHIDVRGTSIPSTVSSFPFYRRQAKG
ncbi:glycine cleavage system aminomethyltransferase GcvT [Curtobacterium sp. Leaf261]|uniref:glycine cleavage system aminomethyltransferase GcvT n=1 Tax=Curtobacterium sp. Leaf261 TaxID=1736311 RepID=UPI0006F2B30B|nr:glycine cleavage system aminomethyltransferase GcvT [Curtobacterium sp. Leaf261]KQO63156.1 glycine cleavage system protein T [Curtobacterium sp. Leaf261]